MLTRVLTFFSALCFTLIGQTVQADECWNLDSEATVAYRIEDLRWKVRSPCIFEGVPTTLTGGINSLDTLKFNNQKMVVLGLENVFRYSDYFYTRFGGHFAWGDKSNAIEQLTSYETSSLYPHDARGPNIGTAGEAFYFQSRNEIKRNHHWDLSWCAGYPFYFFCDALEIVPVGGYAYERQDIHAKNRYVMTSLFPTVLGPTTFPGLTPTKLYETHYTAIWYGPWVGLDGQWTINDEWAIDGCFEYHWVSCKRERETGLGLPFLDDYHYEKHGHKYKADLGLQYQFWGCWTTRLSGNYQRISSGSSSKDRQIYEALGVTGGVGFIF